MKILSHRGYWKSPEEKNSVQAFERSFSLGFGTETDIRDFNGELVISHDIADYTAISLRHFFDIYCKYDKSLTLALNIKSDGLHLKLKEILNEYQIENYFVFDMSVPDAIGYLRNSIKVFTRESEFERIPSFYEESQGLWLDSFKTDWITPDKVLEYLENQKAVCIVSPDLHKREYREIWQRYFTLREKNNLFLCTDFPEEAYNFFKL